jgi:hypothetical protein
VPAGPLVGKPATELEIEELLTEPAADVLAARGPGRGHGYGADGAAPGAGGPRACVRRAPHRRGMARPSLRRQGRGGRGCG